MFGITALGRIKRKIRKEFHFLEEEFGFSKPTYSAGPGPFSGGKFIYERNNITVLITFEEDGSEGHYWCVTSIKNLELPNEITTNVLAQHAGYDFKSLVHFCSADKKLEGIAQQAAIVFGLKDVLLGDKSQFTELLNTHQN